MQCQPPQLEHRSPLNNTNCCVIETCDNKDQIHHEVFPLLPKNLLPPRYLLVKVRDKGVVEPSQASLLARLRNPGKMGEVGVSGDSNNLHIRVILFAYCLLRPSNNVCSEIPTLQCPLFNGFNSIQLKARAKLVGKKIYSATSQSMSLNS